MPTEVLATPRADQQIAALDRRQSKQFERFLDDLAVQGCEALAYRLTGSTPIDHLCVKHLGGQLRVVVAFETAERAWVLLIGPHDDTRPAINIYAELYRLLGIEPPDTARRAKPLCCAETEKQPPVLGVAVTEILDRATQVRRTRGSR